MEESEHILDKIGELYTPLSADCKQDLLKTLETHNFVQLIDTCKECKFHIHTHTLDEILISNAEEKIYICDCHY